MQYIVVKAFSDKEDGKHIYQTGDIYPRLGLVVSAERVAELASKDNVRGEVLIEAIPEPEKKAKPVEKKKSKKVK